MPSSAHMALVLVSPTARLSRLETVLARHSSESALASVDLSVQCMMPARKRIHMPQFCMKVRTSV